MHLCLLRACHIWFRFCIAAQGIIATSGVIAIVMGLAFQNTLGDVFSGLSLSVEKPYECRRCRPSGRRRRSANPASISGLTNRAPGRLPRGFVEKRGGATRYGGRRLLASRNTSWWRPPTSKTARRTWPSGPSGFRDCGLRCVLPPRRPTHSLKDDNSSASSRNRASDRHSFPHSAWSARCQER